METAPLLARLSCLVLVLSSTACREGSGSSAGGTLPIAAPAFGSHGCTGADQSFGGLAAVATIGPDFGPTSRLAAATDTLTGSGRYEIYVTGDAATLWKLEFDPAMPEAPVAETQLVGPGVVDGLAEYAGIATPAELGALAVFDPGFLVVVERSANTLLLVSRITPDAVSVFPTLVPNEAPGNADGAAGMIRFAFSDAVGLLPTGDGRFILADPGNHAIRILEAGAFAQTTTPAGTGAPFFGDGRLTATGFDTPVGLTLSCAGDLIVAETGAQGMGGHRLRQLSIGDFNFFAGGFSGDSVTLVGDGTDATMEGSGATAAAAAPVSPVTSIGGEVYWVDATTGILRRYDPATDTADCPLFSDCATANGSLGVNPNFASQGGGFSLAMAENDRLYALDADAQELWIVVP